MDSSCVRYVGGPFSLLKAVQVLLVGFLALSNGQEVAVKNLTNCSSEEFNQLKGVSNYIISENSALSKELSILEGQKKDLMVDFREKNETINSYKKLTQKNLNDAENIRKDNTRVVIGLVFVGLFYAAICMSAASRRS